MQLDQENLKRKNDELVEALREKNHKYLQTQELYNKLKRRTLLSEFQTTTTNTMNMASQISTASNIFSDRRGHIRDVEQTQSPQQSLPNGVQRGTLMRHQNISRARGG